MEVVEKSYLIKLNMNSGIEKTLRGKLNEETGKEITNADRQEIKIRASSVNFKRCPSIST